MKKFFTVVLGLLLVGVFGATLYYLYSKSEEVPVVFQTASPYRTSIIMKAVATGSVVPRKEVAIKPQVSGIVERLEIEPGSLVQRGDLLARIRIIPDVITLNSAESRVKRARIASENADRERKRNQRLYDEGISADVVLKQFELALHNANEELTSAEDNLELIRTGSASRSAATTNTLVRATVAGMVLEVPIEEGDSVIESNTFNDGTTIATIANMDELVFEGNVDESEVGKIRAGMDLLLTIGALEGQQFSATLEHISPKGIEENGAIQFEIRAAIASRDDVFVRANLSANADIVLNRADDVLAINESLLQFEEDKTYVEIETSPQEFEKRYVETGLSDGISIEVVSGLEAGDKIKDPNLQSGG